MANSDTAGWLTGLLTAAGAALGAAARTIISRWRSRRHRQADFKGQEATTADTLVGTAMRLLEQLQCELESVKEQLGQCREERRTQEEVLVGLRSLVNTLTSERDSLRDLLDQATRPR